MPEADAGGVRRGPAPLEAPAAKRPRPSSSAPAPQAAESDIFGSCDGQLYIAAQTATIEWRIEDFMRHREEVHGMCIDGPTFGPRDVWQVFCHPDGRCHNLPQGGPPGVFLRYLGVHERVPAYATIEKLTGPSFQVPANNARDAPFVVLFGRSEIEEWGVCKDFGLFDDGFATDLTEKALVIRARITWIEPRGDSLLPREVVSVRKSMTARFTGEESLANDLATLWAARSATAGAGSSGGRAAQQQPPSQPPRGDVVLVAEGTRYEADRVLLAARSAYFRAMFSFREAKQQEVELADVPARALAAALRFAYTDEGPELHNCEEAVELMGVASKLSFPGLLRICSDYLRDTWLSIDNVVSLLRLADQHGASSLRSEALVVVAAHFDVVKVSPEWEEFVRTGMNPSLIQDLLQSVQAASIFAGRASIKI
eukprot:TRINITY_DN91923_c0_g1_i1.p1 TRINITY_DN91923_c0_g1~~TRINITY_DN91923_c0_g1_i1.p1  ORF type:complete len:427 (+),score=85.07 TRINITY_DN91923_c0_g1_i1:111-1391(+)